MTNLHELARAAATGAQKTASVEECHAIADAVLLVVSQYYEQEKKNDGAALLPADPLASPPTTETLPNKEAK